MLTTKRSLAVLVAAIAGAASAQTAVTTPGGTTGTVPLFTGTSTVGTSAITQTGSSIGIGTANPASALDVNGSIVQRPGVANNAGNYLQTNANNTADQVNLNPGILFFGGAGSIGNEWGADLGFGNNRYRTRLFANSAIGDVALSYASFNPTSQASFTDGLVLRGDSGNVGIGTSSPGARLEVNGGLKLSTGSPGITFGDGTTQMSAASSSPTSLGTVKTGVWNATPIAAAYLPSDVDYIDQAQTITGQKSFSGNVGLGTTTPGAVLDVWDTPGWIPYTSYQLKLATTGYKNADQPTIPADSAALSFYRANYVVGGAGNWARTLDIRVRGVADGNGAGMGVVRLFANSAALNSPETEIMRVQGNGNVGIGTTTPGSPLEVFGNIAITAKSGGSITYQDGSVQSVAWNGVLPGGDYAESVDVSGDRAEYEPGDVLVVDPNADGRFVKSSQAYSTTVMGIYSTRPGVVGRRQKSDRSHMAEEVPMAMIGVVPTKVTDEGGPIKRGDLLVTSSKPGFAMKGKDRSLLTGAIIGKALGHLDSGTGVIEVAVSLQ